MPRRAPGTVASPVGGRESRDGLQQHILPGPVAIGSVGSVAGERAVDEARIEFVEPLPSESQPIHRSRAETLDQHVGSGEQVVEHLPRLVGLEVDGDASNVAVAEQEEDAHAIEKGIGSRPRPLERPGRWLDLDHVGPQIGEQLACGRALQEVGEADDSDAG